MNELFKFFKKRYFDLSKNAKEDLAYRIETQIFKFWIFGVVIHPEMPNKILRPMVKELVQLDLPFLSCGQITVNFDHFLKMAKFDSVLAITQKQ